MTPVGVSWLIRAQFLLSAGGPTDVFLAIDTWNHQKVSVKKLRLNGHNVKEITTEIAIMKTCKHPNIVNYIDSYIVEDNLWVVREYMGNGSLDELTYRFDVVKLGEKHIAMICREILQGLQYIHDIHGIHYNIRSDTIFLGKNGEVKLADFGSFTKLTSEHIYCAMVFGAYSCPELTRGDHYGTNIDIWALGIMCMEMAEGEPPYMDHSYHRAKIMVITKGIPPLKEPQKWSPEFKDFIGSCLQTNPKDRPNATELLKHEFLKKAGSSSDLTDAINSARQQREAHLTY